MVPDPSDPQSLNRYSYVRNRPLNYTDPTGHRETDGCEYEGCQTDEGNEIVFYTKYLVEHGNEVLAELTLFGYAEAQKNLSSWTPEDGPLTPTDDPFVDAVRTTNQRLRDHPGQSPGEIYNEIEQYGTLSDIIAMGIVVENMRSIASAERGAIKTFRNNLRDCSFSADTLVATEDGKQAIATLKVGDRVLAYNPTFGVNGYYTVTAVFAHNDPVVEYLTIDGEKIATTPEHPFYTLGVGWLPAGELWVGVLIRKADGKYGTVQGIQLARRIQPMYNLTVAQAHTFFVGQQQWLVHNACKTEFGTWYGKGGWQNRTTIDGDELTVKQLTPRDVDNLGLHRSKRPFGAGATDNIYGDKNGGLWISNDKGFLSQFP